MKQVVYLQPISDTRKRANQRAREIMDGIKQDPTFVKIPANLDPFVGNFEKEVADALYKRERDAGK